MKAIGLKGSNTKDALTVALTQAIPLDVAICTASEPF